MSKIMRGILYIVVSLLSFVPFSLAQQSREIEISLQPEVSSFENDAPIIINFTLTNQSSNPIRVLRWTTPINGISDDLFVVTRGSQRIQYIGRMAKRGEPTEEDFVTIEPGKPITVPVNLSMYYAIYEAGDYTITYETDETGLLVGGPDNLIRAPVVSNAATFRLLSGRTPPELVPLSSSEFDKCSSSQQDDLNAALTEANNIASMALQVLQDTPSEQQPNAQRYVTWFGVHTVGLYAKTIGNFSKISDAPANKAIVFGCSGSECEPIDYAYVYPNQPYGIFVCDKFWSAPLKGTDSRSGTIIHEVSHFGVVAATRDFAYGHNASKLLAVQNPPRATSNADSTEYFAENDPEIPM